MKLFLVGVHEPNDGMSFHPFHSQEIWLGRVNQVAVTKSCQWWQQCCGVCPFSCHLQACRCKASHSAWFCLTRSEHLRCIPDQSLKRSKDARTYLAEAQIWQMGRFTYHPSSSTCGRRDAGLLSSWGDLSPQSLPSQELPECGQEHQFREWRRKKVPWWCGCVLRLFPWGGGGLILFQGFICP